LVEESRLDALSRLTAGSTSRRLALGIAAAVGGLALAGEAEAKKDASAEKWRRKRGRRGRRGKKGRKGPSGPPGPEGPSGPPAGASVWVVNEVCDFPDVGVGARDGCEATCPEGYVATGGGYQMGANFLDSLGRVTASRPVQAGNDLPTGWVAEVEYLDVTGFSITTYAICVPE
jgi:hypothetical protein